MTRFEVRSPPGLPNGRTPEPEPVWAALLRGIPLAVLLGILGAVFGWGVRYATFTSASEAITERVLRLEARADQADKDRDSRAKTSNDRLDTAVAGLRDKIEELGRDLQSRSTARTEQFNKLGQDVNTLKLKVCVLSGNKVNQCSG